MTYATQTKIGLRGCPYLGRCDDRDTFYSFPSFENCCHSEPVPTPIEPSYQADYCLGEKFPECSRYLAAKDGVNLPEPVKAGFPRLSVWAIAGIVAGVVLFLGVLLLILRPKELPAATFTPTAGPATLTASAAGTAIAAESATPTATLSPTASPSPSATATWTPTYTPAPTRTPTPTRTRRPTRTPTLTPTRTATATPTPTQTPTKPPPSETQTPAAAGTPFPAPTLLSPADGEVFPHDATIALSWQSVGPLTSDLFYAITVAYLHNGETWYDDVPWTKETSWRLSDHKYLVEQGLSDDGRFRWSVQVMQQTGTDANGRPTGIVRSPSSKVRTLIWLPPLGPGAPVTPPPPPP